MRFDPRLPIRRRLAACAALILPLAMLGCGGGKGTVSGDVTLDGKPVPGGTVVFTPASGAAVAANIKDGKYTASGVPTGPMRVSLDVTRLRALASQAKKTTGKRSNLGGTSALTKPGGAPSDLPPGAKEQMELQQKNAAETEKVAQEAVPIVRDLPKKYEDPSQSGLTTTVSSGNNTYNLNLTSK